MITSPHHSLAFDRAFSRRFTSARLSRGSWACRHDQRIVNIFPQLAVPPQVNHSRSLFPVLVNQK